MLQEVNISGTLAAIYSDSMVILNYSCNQNIFIFLYKEARLGGGLSDLSDY